MIAASAPMTGKLVDSLYVEAMVLADEARAYFDSAGRADRMALDPMLRVTFSCESLKVTTRLMHVIAWLLSQRARSSGELRGDGWEDAGDGRLSTVPDTDAAALGALPPAAASLVEASRDLYARVQRMDEGSHAAPAASPARSLMRLLERSL